MSKEQGTCDICSVDNEIEITVHCPECEQSNQICKPCLDNSDTGYLFCRECDHVLDTS